MNRKNVSGALSRRSFVKPAARCLSASASWGSMVARPQPPKKLARCQPARIVDRDSPRQHHSDSYRQGRLRPELHLHRVPADCGGRTKRLFEAITTVVMGDTDRTPDGSGAFDFLGSGMPNIRKAAAYTYQALLDLAAQRLGVPKNQLSVKAGVVSGGGKSISYGDLVKGRQLKLTIPVKGDLTSMFGLSVEGNPPLKPVSQYTVIGKSFRNSVIVSKVTAKETWATDVRLPGMLHARMVHPKTLGSALELRAVFDKTRFPNAQVVVKGNLVGVVAPTEWEAIKAADQVAAATKWKEGGLPATPACTISSAGTPIGKPRA